MKFFFFNSYFKKRVIFIPYLNNLINIYSCGPTVYNFSHLGNLRFYIFTDFVKSFFYCLGFKIFHVMNITDVGHLERDSDYGEDKINKISIKKKISPLFVTNFYKYYFLKNLKKIFFFKPDFLFNASDIIYEIRNFIFYLEKSEFSYFLNGNMFFNVFIFIFSTINYSINFFSNFSKLEFFTNNIKEKDFVLWFNNSKFKSHLMKWNFSLNSNGFPGWHIECSSITLKFFLNKLDIHISGQDHFSIHNKNEIFQSEAFLLNNWVKLLFHVNFLLVNEKKMSKSLNNFLTLKDLYKNGFSPLNFRFYCLNFNYKNEISFNFSFFLKIKKSFKLLISIFFFNLNKNTLFLDYKIINFYRKKLWYFLYNDFDGSSFINFLFIFLKKNSIFSLNKFFIFFEFNRVFKFLKNNFYSLNIKILFLIRKRLFYRNLKKYLFSDLIRNKINISYLLVKDSKISI